MDNICRFYLDSTFIRGNLGFTYSDVMNFSNKDLEKCHNYIQWLFPTEEPSQFNINSPLPTVDTLITFTEYPILQERMIKAHEKLRKFLFYRYLNVANEPVNKIPWVTDHNHNFLRITRMLKSSAFFGDTASNHLLYEMIDSVLLDHAERAIIVKDSIPFWEAAVIKAT